MNQEENEFPHISIKDGVLSITISAEELAWVTEAKRDSIYKVKDNGSFLEDFANTLLNYRKSNAMELGITELQYFLDQIIDATIEHGSESVDYIEDS